MSMFRCRNKGYQAQTYLVIGEDGPVVFSKRGCLSLCSRPSLNVSDLDVHLASPCSLSFPRIHLLLNTQGGEPPNSEQSLLPS